MDGAEKTREAKKLNTSEEEEGEDNQVEEEGAGTEKRGGGGGVGVGVGVEDQKIENFLPAFPVETRGVDSHRKVTKSTLSQEIQQKTAVKSRD